MRVPAGFVCLAVSIFSQSHFGVLISVLQSKNSKSLGLAEKNASLDVLNLPFATPHLEKLSNNNKLFIQTDKGETMTN